VLPHPATAALPPRRPHPAPEACCHSLAGGSTPWTAGQAVHIVSRMTTRWERRAVRLAWSVALFTLGLLAAGVVLLALDWAAIDSPGTAQLALFLGVPINGALGVLIATRRPRNAIGWFLLVIAAAGAVYLFTDFLAIRGLLSGAVPDGWVAWPGNVFGATSVVAEFLIFFLILFFPNGRLLPGPRWRLLAGVALAAIALAIVQSLISVSTNRPSPRLPGVPNPLAVPALSGLTGNDSLLPQLAFLLLILLVLTAVVVRFRRSRDLERLQMRGFAYVAGTTLAAILLTFSFTPPNDQLREESIFVLLGTLLAAALALFRRWRSAERRPMHWVPYVLAATLGVGFLSYSFTSPSNGVDVANVALGIGFAVLLPATIGLAVIRHGLYDLDILISRTIVYGSLAVFITGVYVGIAVGIGTLVGSGGKPNLALSILATAGVAVGFQPVRERVQKVANRLVYGNRATPYEVLSQFSERVAESYASDDVLPRMARVLAEGTSADLAEVWLRSGDTLQRAAVFPLQASAAAAVHLNGSAELSIPTADRAVVVRHQGDALGALTVTKRRGESLTPIEIKLMDDLAQQAGLVLKNVALTSDLLARLDDLRASRQRLVAAQDDERRKLERNLHDGAQQHLVAIKVKLGLVEMLLTRDPEKASATIVALKSDADEALETLRDLARGIYPPLLADRGLAVALRSQAGKATLPVHVDADGVGRYSQDIEAALYFCTLEALQNVQKYAKASNATVRLREAGHQLLVEVTDDGRGFDANTAARGAGLTNMEDRLEALGGTLHIETSPGHGTILRAAVPVAVTMVTS
jgi:signal transduction histidine kinase